jgi:hypothetical protein
VSSQKTYIVSALDVHTYVPRDNLCRLSFNSRIFFFFFLFHTAKIENAQRYYEIYAVSSPVCVLAMSVKALGGREFVCDLNNNLFLLQSINYSNVLL